MILRDVQAWLENIPVGVSVLTYTVPLDGAPAVMMNHVVRHKPNALRDEEDILLVRVRVFADKGEPPEYVMAVKCDSREELLDMLPRDVPDSLMDVGDLSLMLVNIADQEAELVS